MPTQGELDTEENKLRSMYKARETLSHQIKGQQAIVRSMKESGIDPEPFPRGFVPHVIPSAPGTWEDKKRIDYTPEDEAAWEAHFGRKMSPLQK